MHRALPLTLLALVALSGCSADTEPRPDARPAQTLPTPPAPPPTVTGAGKIVAVRGRPVELCAGTEGFPPQCDGRVEVRRLDLSAVPGLTTTGALSYTEDPVQLTGTLEGSILTVTEPPALDTEPPSPLPSLATPCPVPSGGWPPPPSFGASGLIDDYVARAGRDVRRVAGQLPNRGRDGDVHG